jgi:hypothetical protein
MRTNVIVHRLARGSVPPLVFLALTLVYTDHHLALSIVAAPVIWATANPVLAYNILFLLSFVLTGWAVYCLTNDLSRRSMGRYIVYRRDAAVPGTMGMPVATFNRRHGRVVDAEPVPLPLTVIQ